MKILAVDLGDARTGLACCDRGELIASPVGTIQERRQEAILGQVAAAAREQKAEEIVVGHPRDMNGTLGPRSALCREFAQRLAGLVKAPVRLWDERGTTVTAIGYLNQTNTRGKKRKAVVDTVAATIILENYLAYRRNHPQDDPLEAVAPWVEEEPSKEETP